MKEVKFTRQELYDLVWSQSMISISKKYAISVEGLRKTCRSLGIPFPNPGYWIKVKSGKEVNDRRLLGDFAGNPIVNMSYRISSEKPDISLPKKNEILQSIKKDEIIAQALPSKLSNADILVISVKNDLLNKKVWRSEGIVSSSRGELRIDVSPKNLQRALILMDLFIKTLKSRGHDIRVEDWKTNLIILGEKIPIRCREKFSKSIIKKKYGDRTEYRANDLLSLKIDTSYSPKEWMDGKKKVEEQLPEVIAYLELKAKNERERRLDYERKREEQKENQRKEKEIQDMKEVELDKFKSLFLLAKRHHNANKIREYADKFENRAVKNNQLTEELKLEIEWMRKKADWYDPLIESDEELMRVFDRDELELVKKNFNLQGR